MKSVWKFQIPVDDHPVMNLPVGASILSVAFQGEDLVLWALVDPDADKEPRRLRVAGTGHAIEESDLRFIGTAVHTRTGLVFHVFEIT